MGQFDNKSVLVTGASSGIGLAVAERFVVEGAHVFITGRRESALNSAIEALGSSATAITGDINDLGDLDRLFETVRRTGKGLDVLVANAGGGDTLATIAEVTPESYQATFDGNVRGTIFTVQKALPLLADGGSIVVTGSSSASRGTPGFGMYSASKAALRQLVRTWAGELAPRRIRVNAVVPGSTDTPGLRSIPDDPAHMDAMLAGMAAGNPLGRLARPSEIASAVLFLASDQASFVTGAELFADGGEVQVYPR